MTTDMLRRSCLAALLLLPLGACRAKEETVSVSITGLDHLAEHLSIQDFWVNGTNGHQAGKGGRKVCCATIPAASVTKATVRVRWDVTNWKRRIYGSFERDVPVEWYEDDGQLWVHFLPDGSVRAVISGYAAWGDDGLYPGPSYDTVLRDKRPWTIYKRKPGDRDMIEVADPMKDATP